ncbi:MAG: peptidase [Anaerocolumna sp.]|nr:peptidase [Anaerocolumna sp.]
MSGFTGSAGTLVVTLEEAGLWTDGRYFIQAARQLEGSGITLYKMGEEGIPTIAEFLCDKLKENCTLGFDGRVINTKFGQNLMDKLGCKKIKVVYDKDLVAMIWTERPTLSSDTALYSGCSVLRSYYLGKGLFIY